MGYRSVVRSCIYSDDAELFDSFIASQKLINNPIFGSPTEENGWIGFEDNITYTEKVYSMTNPPNKQTIKILDMHGEDWKWYEEHDDVKAWNKLCADAEEAGLNWEFARIGEETGDIEYESGGLDTEYFLSTVTSIYSDYD